MEKVFQSSLFGYSKKSVMSYIASMNDRFTKQMLDKDLESKKIIQELQQELEQLRQENEKLQEERREVAGALIDAKAYAAELRAQAEAEHTALREDYARRQQAELQKLQTLAAKTDVLRAALRSAIGNMDAELARHGAQCQAVQEVFIREVSSGRTAAPAEAEHDTPA